MAGVLDPIFEFFGGFYDIRVERSKSFEALDQKGLTNNGVSRPFVDQWS
jgi:hypothetical protein